MNTFGLGLLITFDDQASEGIARVTQSYLGLESAINQGGGQLGDALASQVGLNLSQMGDSLINAGSGILSVFSNLTSNVKNTGQEFENFKITLGAIYKDEAIVEQKLQQLFDFSVKAPFDVGETKDMLLVLKSQGIEAFDELTSASSNFSQEGLSWITDLMAFKPDEKMSRWKLAITNFLGSGDVRSLTSILDAGKITDIIGRDIADTSEGRLQDLMDIVTNLGVEGLTEKMAGTLETKLSNLSDFFTKFYYKIADAGAFDQFKRIISNVTAFLIDESIMGEDRLNGFTKSISEGLSVILDPIERLTEKFKGLSLTIVDFVSEHPNILKIGIVITTVVGSALVLLGVFTKLGGAATSFLASLKYLSGGKAIFSMLGTGFLSILKIALPLVALGYIFYKVWSLNIGGIQEKVANLTETLGLLWDGLDGEMSAEALNRAREIGILPLIEAVLQLKYHWGFFVDGFKKGLDSFFQSLGKVLNRLGIFDVEITGLRDFVTELLEKLTEPGMTDNWERMGEVVGNLTGKILVFGTAIWGIYKVFKLITGLSTGLSALRRIPILGGLFGGSSGGGSTAIKGGFLANPFTVIKSLISMTLIIGAVIGVIEVLGLLEKTPGFNRYLDSGLSVISKLFLNLIPIISSIVALSLAVKLLDLIKLSPKDSLKGVADLAIILVGFTAIVGIIGAITHNPDISYFITSGTKTLSLLFKGLTIFTTPEFWGACLAIAALGLLSPATVASGVAGLAIIIGGIGLVVAAFGALTLIPGYSEFMESGGEALKQLFTILGEVVGSLIGGLATGITDSLPDIGTNLSEFAENIEPFFEIIGGVNTDNSGDFLVAFGKFVLMLGAEELMSIISGGIDLPAIGTQLATFAENAKPFFDTVAMYPDEGITKATKVFESIAGMGQYAFKFDGLAQLITGETRLDIIGEQLASFAPNGAVFFNTVAGYAEDGISKAPGVFEALKGLGDFDFKFDGLAQLIVGETRLDIIGEQLASFAPSGSIFFNAVAGYSEDGIAKAPSVFTAIAGMGNPDFKFDGFAQLLKGETRLDLIGEQLASFAPQGSTFFNAVAGYSIVGMSLAPSIFDTLSALGDAAFQMGGLAALLVGDTSLDKIGNQLAAFAPNGAVFFNTMSGVPVDGIENAKLVMEMLKVIDSCGLESGGIAQWFTGSVDLSDVGSQLSSFGKKATGFFEYARDFSKKGLEKGKLSIELLQMLGEADIREGGLLGAIFGKYDLEELGTQLAMFGPGATKFFDCVDDIKYASFSNGKKVFETLTALNDTTFKDGGLLQAIVGSVDITSLATNLGTFGVNSRTFFNSVKDLEAKCFTNAVAVFRSLSSMDGISTIILDLGPNTLRNFGEELVDFGDNLILFFDKASEMNTEGFNLTTIIEPFFKVVEDFDSDKLFTISKGMDNVNTSSSNLSTTLKNVAEEVKTETQTILTSIQNCVDNSLTSLNNFSSQGSNIGYNLMVSIANSISANAYLITNAVQNAVNSVNVSIPNIANNTASRVYGPQKMVGLSTGGYVSTTGIAVLHPNEVVVNDKITQGLKTFLNDYKSGNSVTKQTKIEHNIVTNSNQEDNTNNWISNFDDTKIVNSLTSLSGILSTINNKIKDSSNNLGLNTVINPVVNNSVINENSTEIDEVKTVSVLSDILNIITKKSDGILKSIGSNTPLINSDSDNFIPVIKGLIESVSNYGVNHYNNSPLINQDIVADSSYLERPEVVTVETNPQEDDKDKDKPVNNSPIQTFVENSTVLNNNNNVENNKNDSSDFADNRVIFESGSVVIKVENNGNNMTKEELNKCADELMQIIGRKMQLKNLQTRR